MDIDRESMNPSNSVLYDGCAVGEDLSWPFPDNTFDIVMSNKLMSHIDEDERDLVVNESKRVAKDSEIVAHRSFSIP